MNAQAMTAPAPSRLRRMAQAALSRALPTWVYPGPATPEGIWTQDSGFLPWCFDWNYWQEGHRGTASPECAAVEACVNAYAQTAAMLPATHWRTQDDGGRIQVTGSPAALVLRRPNDYQTRSDFVLNIVRALYLRGNSYALAQRDERDRITALHPLLPAACKAMVAPDTQEVFYSIAPTELTPVDGEDWPYDPARIVPARNVWHLKLQTPRSPLLGETPLAAAGAAIAANNNINSQQARFFHNMSRPSGTLNTDAVLTRAQVDELRRLWAEQSAGVNMGGVPILSAGLKWTPLSMSASDAQLIEFYKLSIADIARVMRVPLPLIGESQSTFANTETLMQFWIASGLGFLLEHMESSLDRLFALPRGEYIELDTAALLRSNFRERIDGLVRGVQGGIFSPNEARNTEGLRNVDGGAEPRVQQQVVPLTYWERQLELEEQAAATPRALDGTPSPAAPVADAAPPAPDITEEVRAFVRAMEPAP